MLDAKQHEVAVTVFDRNKRREAEINDALRQEQARHEAAVKNMHRLRNTTPGARCKIKERQSKTTDRISVLPLDLFTRTTRTSHDVRFTSESRHSFGGMNTDPRLGIATSR
jgi:phosphopantothenate synthetase